MMNFVAAEVRSLLLGLGAAFIRLVRRLSRKTVTPVPYTHLEDLGLCLERDIDAADLKDRAARGLTRLYTIDGFWATYFEIPLAADARDSLGSRWHEIVRDPDLRWAVVGLGLPTLLLPRQRPGGFSQPLTPGRLLTCRMHSTFFTALVGEHLIAGLQDPALTDPATRADLLALLHATARELVAAARVHAGTGAAIYCFSEEPRVADPRLNRLLRAFFTSYYDIDSYLVVDVLAGYQAFCQSHHLPQPDGLGQRVEAILERSPLALLDTCLRSVARHAPPRARAWLPPGVAAYGTYLTDGADDIDPGVNVDVLCCLARNAERWAVVERPATLGQIATALDYLDRLADGGGLFSPEVHAFYTPPAFAFLWRRYLVAFERLPADIRRRFDPARLSERVDARIRRHWAATFFDNPARASANAFDLLLLGHAFPDQLPLITALLVAQPATPGTPAATEFLSVAYPARWHFGSPALTVALLLGLPTGAAVAAPAAMAGSREVAR